MIPIPGFTKIDTLNMLSLQIETLTSSGIVNHEVRLTLLSLYMPLDNDLIKVNK